MRILIRKISGKGLAIYGSASILSLLIAACAMNLFGQDFRIPLSYGGNPMGGDAIFGSMAVKTMVENGWYFHNSQLGAPFGLDFYDFPMADGFNVLLIKAISLFSNDSSTIINLFYLLTFPLTTITSTFVFRCLKINNVISATFGLLYAFAPYHFYRGEGHLFLSAYYMIPLLILIALSLWSPDIPFFSKSRSVQADYNFNLLSKKSLFCIFTCLIIGSSGIYYAFFSCFFIVIACISRLLNLKKNYKNVIISTLILLVLISLSSFLNIVPTIVYNHIHGPNLEVAQRQAAETELYGLKVVDLLLPTTGQNRLPILRRLGRKYKNHGLSAIKNENAFAYMGLVAGLGFLYLLVIRVFRLRDREPDEPDLFDRLSVLNLSAILFATIGGTSIFFSLFISPQIRAYNRISIFVNFFALLAIALLLDKFFKKYRKTKGSQIILNCVCLGILIFGIFEQSLPPSTYNYSLIRNEYESDRSFVQSIEQVLPDNAMVFQLPYVAFPEGGGVKKMVDYDLFRAYLHSKTLKWSYGSVQGRNNNWYRIVTDQPLDKILAQISAIGFSGIYIDRYGYSHNGQQLQIELENKLNTKPIISSNQRLMFFDMQKFNKSRTGSNKGQ